MDLPQLRQVATAQDQAHQQIQQALQAGLTRPHTITRMELAACAVAEERHPTGPVKVLLIAGPDGRRMDVPLSPQLARQIARALATEYVESEAA